MIKDIVINTEESHESNKEEIRMAEPSKGAKQQCRPSPYAQYPRDPPQTNSPRIYRVGFIR